MVHFELGTESFRSVPARRINDGSRRAIAARAAGGGGGAAPREAGFEKGQAPGTGAARRMAPMVRLGAGSEQQRISLSPDAGRMKRTEWSGRMDLELWIEERDGDRHGGIE